MTNDMDGVDASAAVQIVHNLLKAIFAAVQYHGLASWFERRYQLLETLHAAVDEDDFLALTGRGTLWRRGHRFLRGICGACRIQGVGRLAGGRVSDGRGDRPVEHHARFQRKR